MSPRWDDIEAGREPEALDRRRSVERHRRSSSPVDQQHVVAFDHAVAPDVEPFAGLIGHVAERHRLAEGLEVGSPPDGVHRSVRGLPDQRGINVSHITARFWWNRFRQDFASEVRRKRV